MPTEDEQYEQLSTAIASVDGRPMIVRTADFGADKRVESLPQEIEDNPFLGLRSIRYCLCHLDMFKTQLRAIMRASVEGDVRIMFPMITTLMELRQAKAVLADVMEDLDERGIPYRQNIPVGIMVETPAAAMLSASFSRELQFMSIGTNDLTQYTLAVDRGNERVAYLYSPHNPAVLRLIRQVVRNAYRYNVAVNLCGEMAGDPLYCQLLIGLGLRQLSMAPKNIPEIKKIIRSTTLGQCRAIAKRVMQFDADRQVINFLREETRKIVPEAV
jgi:phosphotransferase system enzyme I (PtsI)